VAEYRLIGRSDEKVRRGGENVSLENGVWVIESAEEKTGSSRR
jgi:hypothetical protein